MITKLRAKFVAVGIAVILFAIQNHVNAAPSNQKNKPLSSDTYTNASPEPLKVAVKKVAQLLFSKVNG
ncbi:hypothetical protein SAMN05444487_10525 [Marininema mesophilum]|uniref:Uncharacterized protein n=1 Tax=Marininema mesophilum TaxID=1048340 RepID=A0A1H2V8L0_9BACL|nr:hypothetical protein [Marininema mesophilum]SDW64652.1 hypothetical protein SAMN05444487_10525 [Marininema mesophilum]